MCTSQPASCSKRTNMHERMDGSARSACGSRFGCNASSLSFDTETETGALDLDPQNWCFCKMMCYARNAERHVYRKPYHYVGLDGARSAHVTLHLHLAVGKSALVFLAPTRIRSTCPAARECPSVLVSEDVVSRPMDAVHAGLCLSWQNSGYRFTGTSLENSAGAGRGSHRASRTSSATSSYGGSPSGSVRSTSQSVCARARGCV